MINTHHHYKAMAAVLWLLCAPLSAPAAEPYSPNVERAYPDTVFWGDTHLHTALSGDAFALGSRLTPDDAYRFAKGEAVRADRGEMVRLRRPLDFLMVSDHAENLGVLPRLAAGDRSLPTTDVSQRWARAIARVAPTNEVVNAPTSSAFQDGTKGMNALKAAWQANYEIDDSFRRSVWTEVVANAERHYDPGRFTTFAGFEWSARMPAMIHRNVLFADGPDRTTQVLPFSRFDSDDPEALWKYLDDYEDRTGGRVIAIPHNGNLSGGKMFALRGFQGKPLTQAYANTRARWEPIYEVTQIKGDGETHALISPDDQFADYETWPRREKATADSNNQKRSSYARSALKLGLEQQVTLGTNPFKFGMIGSTDSHTGLATADENNFWGKMGSNEPSPYRAISQSIFGAAGYAAVWAHENTRESLFAAMKRREVYATTGPRITLRFFGGWDFDRQDAMSPRLAGIGYRKGVPMGGDLTSAPEGGAASFLIRAVKDPDGANLDRIQVVKGWRDQDGQLHERVYDAALSDGRTAGAGVEPVGNTVNLDEASYTNSIGDPELAVTWTDPDFHHGELAFYYVRVLEIPTPRWTAFDAKFFGIKHVPDETPMVIQERAYSSPIWYTPTD